MADVWVLLATIAFFGVCVAFVYGCDRIIGPDEEFDFEPSAAADEPSAGVVR